MSTALALIGFVLPLGLDSFAIAASIGAAGPMTKRGRWRISLTFMALEAGMPLIGLAIGAPLAAAIGPAAGYVAAGAVFGTGLWMLLHEDDTEKETAGKLITARGATLLGLGLGISLDELAIGFSLGLVHLPVVPVLAGIAAQAFVAAQLGLRLGNRISERYREGAERLAGIVLLALGLSLAAEQLFA
ncbi:manganese efflux pump MntP [Amycolatopsis jiangsuensis]|uniref:Putative Mn2+ efflux pump MntP n=1 Tax=Amycolatopsis jiangsuensis TaxID=1181879 RepID=A0A840IY54_9PSEU|nr:manganese efflux pump [Amycolatopsis jiangsuensis]MBB4686780.1 putative Mn2+ efflux pump MntP [Amycolatopsis jiangsuensis]